MKDNQPEWQIIFGNHASNKGLLNRKELTQLNSKVKQTNKKNNKLIFFKKEILVKSQLLSNRKTHLSQNDRKKAFEPTQQVKLRLSQRFLSSSSILIADFFPLQAAKASNEKTNLYNRIHSAGTNRHPRASVCNLHTSLPHLCIQHYWKPDDHHPHTTGLPSPHAHAFLLLELLLLRNCLYNHFHSQATVQHINWEQEHHLCWLLHSVFLCHISGGHRVLPSGCHVL